MKKIGVISDTHGLLREKGYQIVISGHSHKPKEEMKEGVLYFNPGSAGPRRFSLPISLGFLEIQGTDIKRYLEY